MSWFAAAAPIGVSFYTFQKIGYLADVHTRKTAAMDRLSEFLLYVAFFPRVLAGPIVKAADFAAQLATDRICRISHTITARPGRNSTPTSGGRQAGGRMGDGWV